MKFGLKDSFWDKIVEVFSNFPQISHAKLFGSRAKGNFRENSDIDIVLFGKDLNLSTLNKIDLKIEDLFMPYQVDLILFETIDNDELINHINRVGVTIFKNQNISEINDN